MKHIKRFLFSAPSAERPLEAVDPFPLMALPDQLIEYVLSFVSHTDLLKSCRNTCKLFRNIIDSNSFWKIKCLRDGKSIPVFHLQELPPRYYLRIYTGNPYGRNLLRNGHGDSPKGAFTSWRVIENGGDGWKYEETPKGADPLPLDKQGCFSTSYGPCTKEQIINLVNEGVLPEIMDNFKPHIEVSEWHAARFDCGSEYRLTVSLLNDKRKVLLEYTTGSIVTEQWVGREWNQVTHVFRDYPSGVRFIQFRHSGCDTQFWAGNYGSKMAGGVVRIRGDKQEPVAAQTVSA